MTTSDFIAIASIVIAIVAFMYTYLTNTKKYELTSQYRFEILNWYSITIAVLMRLKHETESLNSDLKKELLSKLSAQIEIGRFYFPNISKGDNFGNDKPFAYRGYRNLALDFLVYLYNLYAKNDSKNYIKHIDFLQRHFTSNLFETIDPLNFLQQTKKHTSKTFFKELIYDDFIEMDPENFSVYLNRTK